MDYDLNYKEVKIMKIVMFGLPASGKGTMSYELEKSLNIPQLSTGDLLRRLFNEDTSSLGDEVRKVPIGHFASDELIIRSIKEELKKEKYKNGVIFDGFPRTEVQAQKMIEMGLIPDAVVFLKAKSEEIIERIVNRRVHPQSGRIYNLISNPPKEEGKDDVTNEPLVHRDDDKLEYIERRLLDFKEKTLPAFNLLKSLCKYGSGPVLVEINGMNMPKKVFHDLLVGIKSTKSIQAIRKDHQFVFIQTPFNGSTDEMITKQLNYARSCVHESLMEGKIPFSSNIFYSQENILNFKDEKKRVIALNISKQLISEFGQLAVYTDNDITDPYTANPVSINGKEIFVDKDTQELIEYAISNSIHVEIKNNPYFRNDDRYFKNTKDFHSQEIDDIYIPEFIEKSVLTLIESPYAGTPEEILENEAYARHAVKDCLSRNEIPFASHILYTQPGVLDDTQSAQRRLGIEAGLIMGQLCQKTALYEDRGITPGMEEGVERAFSFGRNVEHRNLNKEYSKVLKIG